MTAIGRNDTCPCGSGKKYKKCCLAVREVLPPPAPPPRLPRVADLLREPIADGLNELAELSNSVIALAAKDRFEDALAACKRLLEDFPDVVDGLERSAMVHAKMGNNALAAEFYGRALDFVTHPSRRDDYEEEGFARFYRLQIEKLGQGSAAP